MTLRYLSGYNGYLPELTGQVVAYVRKEKDFPLARYVQYVPTDASVGVYTKLERDAFVRRVTDEESAWEDGDPRPKHHDRKIRFDTAEFRTKRRDYGWTVGYKAIEQTKAFKVKPAHMDMAISEAMTNRTNNVWALLDASGSWGAQTAAANTLNGGVGKWDVASATPGSNYLAIYKSMAEVALRIHLATNGKVKPTDLRFVVNPTAAVKISGTDEMNNYVRESPYAERVLKEGLDPQFQTFGMPSMYRGFQFVVEDTPKVTEHPKAAGTEATTNRVYVKDSDSCVVLSRPGGLDGEYGSPSFSTVQVYHYGAMIQVEAFDNPKDRLVEGHVSEDVAPVLTSIYGGFLISDILS